VLVTQRSAVLNKDVLTQAQLLVALRTIAPQDIAAMRAWIEVHGTPEQQETLMASLPSLPVGDAWFWAPGWPTGDGIFQRVHVLPIETFDSGATPGPGARPIEPKTAAAVDLEALDRQMAATIERAKAEDPKALQAEVARLKREIAAKPAPAAAKVARVEVPVLKDGQLARLEKLAEKAQAAIESYSLAARGIAAAVGLVKHQANPIASAMQMAQRASATNGTHHPRTPARETPRPQIYDRVKGAIVDLEPAAIGKGEAAVLSAIAQHGAAGVTREQLSVLTGYKRSTRDAYLARLQARGAVEANGGDRIIATSVGIEVLGDRFQPLPTGAALRAHWMERLPDGERRVLEPIVNAYPNAIASDELDASTGFKRSTRDAYLCRLNARKLIERAGRGEWRASGQLFDGGSR